MSAVLDELRSDPGSPITLITGQPGAGKTLYALATFAVGRVGVYQRGVAGCKLPEWDPEKWDELAPGSTLIVDEAREVYAPKPPTQEAPAHYQLHRIRHTGVALVIICQHPNDIDSRVRRLAGRHVHLVDVFGAEEAVVHEWREVRDPDVSARAESVQTRFKYPRNVYALYKSSAQHRRVERVPARVRMIKWLWVAAVACAVLGPLWLWSMMAPDKATEAKPAAVSTGVVGRLTAVAQAAPPVMDPQPVDYLASYQPRVPGLAHTAPAYDGVTAPVVAPYPAACVEMRGDCRCYTAQATRLDTPADLCRSIVAGGFFVGWQHPTAPSSSSTTAPGAQRDQAAALAVTEPVSLGGARRSVATFPTASVHGTHVPPGGGGSAPAR